MLSNVKKNDMVKWMSKEEEELNEIICTSTREGFLSFLEDTTQRYVDSIDTLDELSVVALLLAVRMGQYEEDEDYEICSIIKEKMDMIDKHGMKLLKQKEDEKN